MKTGDHKSQSGNVFTALLGGVALVGILGVTAFNTLSGPVSTVNTANSKIIADNQLLSISKIVIMDAGNQTAEGDCDGDGLTEPAEWRDGGTPPTGGGLVPLSLGAPTVDPWGSDYGYCAWDVGGMTADAACDLDGDAETDDRLDGADDPTVGDNDLRTVMAVISAGPDRVFQTECKDYATAVADTSPLVVKGGDDIVMSYTYVEAGTATSSVWNIKSGDSTTAEISKNIEIKDSGGTVQASIDRTGVGEFDTLKTDNLYSKTGGTTPVAIKDGVIIENTATEGAACATLGMVAVKDDASGTILSCGASNTWTAAGGGGAASSLNTDNSKACDINALGEVRYNNTTKFPEFCDGDGDWRPFALETYGVQLVMTPTTVTGMNVTGPCTTDCPDVIGAQQIFTIENQGNTASNPISYNIAGDTANFIDEVTSDCSGVSLDPGDTCEIHIKPTADGNYTYSGTIDLTSDNRPSSMMSGVGSGFACAVGGRAPGGYYVACDVNSEGYDLVIAPGGCDSNPANPTCTGNDSLVLSWGEQDMFFGADSDTNGPQNSVNAYNTHTFGGDELPAIKYCMDFDYEGYTDWYLASNDEWDNVIQPNRGSLSGWYSGTDDKYWTSRETTETHAFYIDISSGSVNGRPRNETWLVRCVRRDGQALPAPQTDTDPDDVDFLFMVTQTASEADVESNEVEITGISGPVSISIDGGSSDASAGFKINGGAKETSDTTVQWGDKVVLVMDAPATFGNKNTMVIDIGDDTYTWQVGAANPALTNRIFVSSKNYRADLGGHTGADTTCTNLATDGGLGGTWKAVLASWDDPSLSPRNSMSFNWGRLENTVGDLIASSWDELWSGQLKNAIKYDEHGQVHDRETWGNVGLDGLIHPNADDDYDTCRDWTWQGSSGNADTYFGEPTSAGQEWIKSGLAVNCYSSNYRALYCMEDTLGVVDETPVLFHFAPNTAVTTASNRVTSNPITIEGLGPAGATVTIGGSDGTPRFTINGGGEQSAATTIYNGDRLRLVMTSPVTPGDRYNMSVSVGTHTTEWFVGTSSGAGTKRIFVGSTSDNGGMGGMAGADSYCQTDATNAGLGGSWIAVLSNGNTHTDWAINRIPIDWGQLDNMNGDKIADDWDDLWDGTLDAPIAYDANGNNVSSRAVFTGHYENGNVTTSPGLLPWCNGWTSGSSAGRPVISGAAGSSSAFWTNYDDDVRCSGTGYLYCIEE